MNNMNFKKRTKANKAGKCVDNPIVVENFYVIYKHAHRLP